MGKFIEVTSEKGTKIILNTDCIRFIEKRDVGCNVFCTDTGNETGTRTGKPRIIKESYESIKNQLMLGQ